MSDRTPATASWWAALSPVDRRRIATLAHNRDDLPPDLFRHLADAHVLAVTADHLASVEAGRPTFPLPVDIRSWVLAHLGEIDE